MPGQRAHKNFKSLSPQSGHPSRPVGYPVLQKVTKDGGGCTKVVTYISKLAIFKYILVNKFVLKNILILKYIILTDNLMWKIYFGQSRYP